MRAWTDHFEANASILRTPTGAPLGHPQHLQRTPRQCRTLRVPTQCHCHRRLARPRLRRQATPRGTWYAIVVCPSLTTRQRTPDDLAPSEHALNPPLLDLRRCGLAHVRPGRHSNCERCHDAPQSPIHAHGLVRVVQRRAAHLRRAPRLIPARAGASVPRSLFSQQQQPASGKQDSMGPLPRPSDIPQHGGPCGDMGPHLDGGPHRLMQVAGAILAAMDLRTAGQPWARAHPTSLCMSSCRASPPALLCPPTSHPSQER
jgi:hypothetical protein